MNAKDEFLSAIKNYEVIGAQITFGGYYNSYIDSLNKKFVLPLLYTDEEYKSFLKFLDRKYDNGYGSQELFGIIVCKNGIWMDRHEYNGSENWEVNHYPDLGKLFGDKLALKYFRKTKLYEIEKINLYN